MCRERQAERFDEVTVDAEPDAQAVVERFDVDVGAAVAQRLTDDPVDQLDDRGTVVEADVGQHLGGDALLVLAGELRDQDVDVGRRAVHLLDVRRDGLLVGRLPHELRARDLLDHLPAGRRRIGGVEDDHAALVGDRHHLVLAGDVLGESADDLLVERLDARVGDGDSAGDRNGGGQVVASDSVLRQQSLTEAQQIAVRLLQRRREAFGVEMAGLHQGLPGGHALVGRLSRNRRRRFGQRGRGAATARGCHLVGLGLAKGHGGRSSELSAVR